MKTVRIRSFFWSIFSCFQSEYRKIRTRNNSVFGHFSRSVLPLYSITVFSIMKFLVKTFMIKLFAWINVFKNLWLFLWDFLYSKYDIRYFSFEGAVFNYKFTLFCICNNFYIKTIWRFLYPFLKKSFLTPEFSGSATAQDFP